MAPDSPAGPVLPSPCVVPRTLLMVPCPAPWLRLLDMLDQQVWGVLDPSTQILPGCSRKPGLGTHSHCCGERQSSGAASHSCRVDGATHGFTTECQQQGCAISTTAPSLQRLPQKSPKITPKYNVSTLELNFCLFVSRATATGFSSLFIGSLKLSLSFSCPLCCPQRQATVTLHFYSCTHLQSSELGKTGVTGAQHLSWPRSLFALPVSSVNECSVRLWASTLLPISKKYIYLFSSVLH